MEVGIPVLLFYLLFKLIDWLTGADLDKNDPRPYSDENQHSDVEDTMWDIYTTDQINKSMQHHDDFNDK